MAACTTRAFVLLHGMTSAQSSEQVTVYARMCDLAYIPETLQLSLPLLVSIT